MKRNRFTFALGCEVELLKEKTLLIESNNTDSDEILQTFMTSFVVSKKDKKEYIKTFFTLFGNYFESMDTILINRFDGYYYFEPEETKVIIFKRSDKNMRVFTIDD